MTVKQINLTKLAGETPIQPRWGGVIACTCIKK